MLNLIALCVMHAPNTLYPDHRAPLTPSVFRQLPMRAIEPRGWVRRQLELEANGFTGRLTEISGWLDKKNNAWLTKDGSGEHGWEEVPYWLKGFGDLGYLLNDKRIIAEAKVWVEGVLGSRRPNGYFGPESNLTANKGKPDIWPNMAMLEALKSYYDYSGDKRVIEHIDAYCKWLQAQPEKDMLLSYWEHQRGGDLIATIFWLYDHTGGDWLLELARKIDRRTADWTDGVPDLHGVNFGQAFREPATMALLTHDANQLAAPNRDYLDYRGRFGEVPGGMYGADENARPGFGDPRQAAETCAMVEMMWSCELLGFQTGDPVWFERCEDVAFNSLPASMTADMKALRYLTSPNQISSDRRSKAPGLQNSGPMQCMDPHDHRCCQHNVSHGWPYFVEHMWAATNGNGLAPVFYGPSKVTAKVGSGQMVTVVEDTNYPFEETVRFKVQTAKAVKFPLTLRVPSWTSKTGITVNGQRFNAPNDGQYLQVNRTWQNGDVAVITLPMQPKTVTWEKNKDAESVQYGPLTFSLKIGEQYKRSGGTDTWPAFEIWPTTPWNYGLVPDTSLKVVRKSFPKDSQPFAANQAPIQIVAKARRLPEWKEDHLGLVGTLQPSPAFSKEPVEPVTLIPMGAARLRISAFPTVSNSARAHRWTVPQAPRPSIPAKASHVWGGDSVSALTDGLIPSNSSDLTIPRFTWWDHKGSKEWIELDFKTIRTLTQTAVYWFDDERTGGGCRTPESWALQYQDESGQWHQLQTTESGTALDRFNEVTFPAVKAKALRIDAKLKPNYSGGVLEWTVR